MSIPAATRSPVDDSCGLRYATCGAYPVLSWLVAWPSFGHLLAAELWLSSAYGVYNGAMIVHLTEIMPEDVRTTGFSLSHSLATILGGVTPAIST